MSVDPLASFRLDGRVAVVTGASSGLGARFAAVLEALGATVVVAARREDRLRELGVGEPVRCDVSVPGASEALIDGVVERHGRVDVVIANAGITSVTPALKETVERFTEIVTVDLIAPYELARAAARHMRAAGDGGVVVMNASSGAVRSMRKYPEAGYISAKTGLLGLTRELALQWARYGIRVNALCPGMFRSEITTALTSNPEGLAEFEADLPMHRLGHEHELDAALAFLASDASSYMTGQLLTVDGGMAL